MLPHKTQSSGVSMQLIDKIWGLPAVFKLWSSCTNAAKIKAIASTLTEVSYQSVLDVGCGPGSNTNFFGSCDYTGIDINPRHIEYAQKRFPDKKFYVQDAGRLTMPAASFDLINVNSLIHHLSDESAINMFTQLAPLLRKNGIVIISEPLIPAKNQYFRRRLQKLDFGKYFRTREQYCSLFNKNFRIDKETPYGLKIFGLTGWNMIVMRLSLKNQAG